jgi:hypothetical protein
MKPFIYTVSAITVMTAAVLTMLVAVVPAIAQEENPCAGDFLKYCSDITPGGGRLLNCYEQKKSSMSAACVAWAETAKANASVAKAACAKEIDERCNSEKGDPLAMLDCLQGHYVSLSMDCRAKLNQFKYYYPQPAK